MDIIVDYIDTKGVQSNMTLKLTKLAFAKHFALAGQGYSPGISKFTRAIGMFLHYANYLDSSAFNANRFSEPPIYLSDPTEKSQFSNLVGKAIADFLSKKIDKSLLTVNYEAEMRLKGIPIKGNRPDLIAYSATSSFAIEAKGRSQANAGNMLVHKKQAKSGLIKVNYSVASVAYNLFNCVKCNYHDPYDGDVPYDNEALRLLSKRYYRRLSEFFKPNFVDYSEFEFNNERFYQIDLTNIIFDKMTPDVLKNNSPLFRSLTESFIPKLILPSNILDLAESGISNRTDPFNFENYEGQNLYIDNDRVGLKF